MFELVKSLGSELIHDDSLRSFFGELLFDEPVDEVYGSFDFHRKGD